MELCFTALHYSVFGKVREFVGEIKYAFVMPEYYYFIVAIETCRQLAFELGLLQSMKFIAPIQSVCYLLHISLVYSIREFTPQSPRFNEIIHFQFHTLEELSPPLWNKHLTLPARSIYIDPYTAFIVQWDFIFTCQIENGFTSRCSWFLS